MRGGAGNVWRRWAGSEHALCVSVGRVSAACVSSYGVLVCVYVWCVSLWTVSVFYVGLSVCVMCACVVSVGYNSVGCVSMCGVYVYVCGYVCVWCVYL